MVKDMDVDILETKEKSKWRDEVINYIKEKEPTID